MIVAVDVKKEYLALREARKLGIPTIGIIDTDSDPDTIDVAIPANDDSIRAVDILLVGNGRCGRRGKDDGRIRSRRKASSPHGLVRDGRHWHVRKNPNATATEEQAEPAAENAVQ